MAELDHTTIAECEALQRVGIVTVINTAARTLDVQIDETIYEDVSVHYHCDPIWITHNHPHSNSERDRMMAAFTVGDEVLILCDDDAQPLYVVGFLSSPKRCDPVIVLVKQVGESYDWWYYNLEAQQGFHENPGAPDPMTPEIVNKWWSCMELDPVEYYTRTTPGLNAISTQECQDSCGLINFDDEECCDSPDNDDDSVDEWYLCPCGGIGMDSEYYGAVCRQTIQCVGGVNPGQVAVYTPGAKNIMSRSGNATSLCDEGTSWGLSVSGLSEEMVIGPRTKTSGAESRNISTVVLAGCGGYESQRYHCDNVDWDTGECVTWYDPYFLGDECYSSFNCTGWMHIGGGAPEQYGHKLYLNHTYQGCVSFDVLIKTAGYSTESVPLLTEIQAGEKTVEFPGAWSQYMSASGQAEMNNVTKGTTTSCLTCNQASSGEEVTHASYSYSETSYGIGGWWTVVTDLGNLAILIPKLVASAVATVIDGTVSGSIAGTTTVVLRIVDEEETDFELANDSKSYALSDPGDFPDGRDALGIGPDCSPRELPLTISQRGFHWHETYNQILVAFKMDGIFYAVLLKKEEEVWTEDTLTQFKTWVEANSLEEHTMYLA